MKSQLSLTLTDTFLGSLVMTTKWDSVADARLLVSILAVTNPTGISWVAVQQMMGDGFKKEGCR